jgi:DNA-binding transcriptional MerR regulator
MAASFDDGKDAGALRTIGEVGEALGIKAHVLRYWEGQFPMLQPLKRSGGRRYYRSEDVALVREIDRLVNREGYNMRGAKAALRDFRGAPGAPPVEPPAAAPPPPPDRRDAPASPPVAAEAVARLRAVRRRLAEALAG